MATNGIHENSGIHQLSPNCYPPSESDDEDSFVVLSNSLGPDSARDNVPKTDPISLNTLELSLSSVSSVLSRQSLIPQENPPPSETVTVAPSKSFSEFSPEEVQRKVDDLIIENTKLKDTLAQNNIAMKKQVDTLAQWQHEVQRVQESHREKFAEMKKYIGILKTENALLRNATALSENKSIESKQTPNESLIKSVTNVKQFETEELQKKIVELEKALDLICLEKEELLKANSKLNDDIKSTKDQLEKSHQDVVSRFTDENSKLTHDVEELTKNNDTLKENVSSLKARVVELENASKKPENLEEMLDTTKQQLMVSQMHLTELKQQNDKLVAERDAKVKDLHEQEKQSQIIQNEMVALRTQVELYKSDFEIERDAKNAMLEEKNQFLEDLRHLQRRNQQLLEELELRGGDFVTVTKEEASAPPPPNRALFACPRCSFKFKDYQALENHVYRCIDLDSLP